MDYIGSDFNSTGSLIPKSALTAARLKRGECVTCGRKCFKKKLFKMIPIDDEDGKILNGRCLHCNPLDIKNGKNTTSQSYHNSTSKTPQRSKSYDPDCTSPTIDDSDHMITQQRRNSLSDLSQTKRTNHHHSDSAMADTHHSTRSDRLPASTSPLQSDGKASTHGHGSRSIACRGSFHSIASSSVGSLDSASSGTTFATTRYSQHRRRPPSRQCSTDSKTVASASSQQEGASREELKRAALILMAAAQEHGLAEAGGTLAASLHDIVNVGGLNGAVSGDTGDSGKSKDCGGQVGDDRPRPREEGGILNRGGAVPMRCGRLIYAGSTRTLSSMSSIDEGDRHNPTTHIQLSQSQQFLRAKSSRTLVSLSTIDGTNEEEINKSDNGSRSGVFRAQEASLPTSSSKATANEGESVASVSLSGKSIPRQEKIHDGQRDETKDYDVEIGIVLQRLKDTIDSSSPHRAVEAIESLSEFLDLSFDDPVPRLNLVIEKGMVGILVNVMQNYPKSSEIQSKACGVLTSLAAFDGGRQRSSSIRLRRSRVMVGREGAGEAIVFTSMILHEDNPTVQKAALNAMCYLCKDCEENQTNFWRLDAIEPILRAMEHHPNEPKVQESGAAVVSMLASNLENKNAKCTIGLNGGVPLVIRAISMHLDDLRVVESCSHALYTLILGCPSNAIVVLQASGATNAILGAMQSHAQNFAVQEIGCAMLANLTTEAENVDLLLRNKGPQGTGTQDDGVQDEPNNVLERVIETILETIQSHSNAPTVQDFGFAVLANLVDSDETKMFIVDMGALDAIVLAMVLHKDDVGVQERACGLLLLLAVQENQRHILAANPIELVKLAAQKFPDECLEPASRLIRQLGLDF